LLKRRTLTSQAIEYVLDLMKSGKVKPGERLPTEGELIATLGVSRTCIREAIKSLESLRLISVRPKIGAIVLEPSPAAMFSAEHLSAMAYRQQTDTLLEFRKILETGVAPIAAAKATSDNLAAMKLALDQHKHALETDGIVYAADIAFHKAIAAASKNDIAIMVLEMISEPLLEQRKMTNGVPGSAEAGLRDHLRIYKAIAEHDQEKARAEMRVHMQTAEHYYNIAVAAKTTGAADPPPVKGSRRKKKSPTPVPA
jgi:GntR family transcriptional repressor for pyruvate dehydrogenase complex